MAVTCVWFRQDLRLHDNPSLYAASKTNQPILLIYILDEKIKPQMGSAQKWWLYHSLMSLQKSLEKKNLKLHFFKGNPADIFENLCEQYQIDSIYINNCYEPVIIERDNILIAQLGAKKINVFRFDSFLLQAPWNGLNKKNQPYQVFTHYWKNFIQQKIFQACLPVPSFNSKHALSYEKSNENIDSWHLLPTNPNWAENFSDVWSPGEKGATDKLNQFIATALGTYRLKRDFPCAKGTSNLSPHLHFGEISPWQAWHAIKELSHLNASLEQEADAFLRQLVWRDFSYHLLYHFPTFPMRNFKKSFDKFPWLKDKNSLRAWQTGQTGFPIVDAGMRELWHTGYMHNRVRMIVASFLTKDLLIHWKEGEKWFWDTLLDADLANNSVSWQWVAGCGVDAAPYFRIFNPILQGEKFDPEGIYIRKWIPELSVLPNAYIHEPWKTPPLVLQASKLVLGEHYPLPMIDHASARTRALDCYKQL